MSAFGKSFFNNTSTNASVQGNSTGQNIPQDIEVPEPPSDTVSSLRFSPASAQTLMMATSWDKTVRIWEVSNAGQVTPRLQQTLQYPILNSCWQADGTKAFLADAGKGGYMWDLASNSVTQIAAHDSPIKTIHHIQAPNYSLVMTGGWDKKLKFWDLRSSTPTHQIELPDKVYCADVAYPMSVVGLANKQNIVYSLENGVTEFKRMDSQLKYQSRCISIFMDKNSLSNPSGFALGSIEGRVGIQCLTSNNTRDTFTFKCHRSTVTPNNTQDIYAVNDIAFHPQFQTLVTVGSDGKFTFWDKDARTKLKGYDPVENQPITCCAIDPKGAIFGYAFGYDWSKGHEYNNSTKKPKIFLHSCMEEMRPQKK